MTGAPATPSCAFCRRERGVVRNLIQGPGAIHICDDCVEAPRGSNGVGAPEAASCAFCLKSRGGVDRLFQGPGGAALCGACVEICHEILEKAGVRKSD